MSLLSSPRKSMFFSSLIQETFSRLENFNLFYGLTFKVCKSQSVLMGQKKKKKPNQRTLIRLDNPNKNLCFKWYIHAFFQTHLIFLFFNTY